MDKRALVAEGLGTFILIFIGAGAVAVNVGGLLGAAFAHGFVVIGLIYAYGHLSGVHINPAVTVGLWVGKQVDTVTAGAYIFVQLVGGILGAFALSLALGGNESGLGATVLADGVSSLQGFFVEAILTFFLVNGIFNTAVSGKAGNFAGVAIGFTLIFCILMGGPLTGASLNPARTIGPALAAGNFSHLWLYMIGPTLGSVLAALLYEYVLKTK